jgi:hypothetical protein
MKSPLWVELDKNILICGISDSSARDEKGQTAQYAIKIMIIYGKLGNQVAVAVI